MKRLISKKGGGLEKAVNQGKTLGTRPKKFTARLDNRECFHSQDAGNVAGGRLSQEKRNGHTREEKKEEESE